MIKRLSYLPMAMLFVAWAFDFFFWGKTPGISFALFVALCLGVGFTLTWHEGLRPAKKSILICLPVFVFGVMTYIRKEPFSITLNYLLTLSLLALLTITYLGGKWVDYSISDYAVRLGKLAGSALVRQATTYRKNQLAQDSELQSVPSVWKRGVPILRGVLLTFPILVIFAALLAAADPIFSQRLESITALFRIEKIPEYLFRTFYILVFAYFFAGIYLHALTASDDKRLIGLEKPWLRHFLGFTEAAIVLIGVNILFASFVVIQFRYFFGGQVNITLEGFTYAEYARRGFGELVVVAFFSLLLLLGLSAITKRVTPPNRRLFSVLGVVQVALLAVILISAFQRLLLYEQAYGFTRLRTYTHVFMVWLGILLVIMAFIEMRSKIRYFAFGALVTTLGFGLTVNLLNLDAFIVRQNVTRALAGAELDSDYLLTLSNDSVPSLFQWFENPTLPADLREDLGSILACRTASLTGEEVPWQSFHLSDYRARNMLTAHREEMSTFSVHQDEYERWYVDVEGNKQSCAPSYWID